MSGDVFGPVLTVYVYPNEEFHKTVDLIDGTGQYALTGTMWVFCLSCVFSPIWSGSQRFVTLSWMHLPAFPKLRAMSTTMRWCRCWPTALRLEVLTSFLGLLVRGVSRIRLCTSRFEYYLIWNRVRNSEAETASKVISVYRVIVEMLRFLDIVLAQIKGKPYDVLKEKKRTALTFKFDLILSWITTVVIHDFVGRSHCSSITAGSRRTNPSHTK